MTLTNSCLENTKLITAVGLIFSFDEHWLNFFYSHQNAGLRLGPEEMLMEARCFSSGEQIMIRVALDLWTHGSYASLSSVAETLDWENLTRVLLAIMTLRDISIDDLLEIKAIYES